MPMKLNISEKGKSWKLEVEAEKLAGRTLGEKLHGKDLSSNLEGFELEITGASDFSGFPHKKDVEGQGLRRIIFTKGWGMHKKPRRLGKKKVQTSKGLRLRKTVRGKQISESTAQVNIKVIKEGHKKLSEIFPDQNKAKEAKKESTPEQPAQ